MPDVCCDFEGSIVGGVAEGFLDQVCGQQVQRLSVSGHVQAVGRVAQDSVAKEVCGLGVRHWRLYRPAWLKKQPGRPFGRPGCAQR
jgi:hypothetical protein